MNYLSGGERGKVISVFYPLQYIFYLYVDSTVVELLAVQGLSNLNLVTSHNLCSLFYNKLVKPSQYLLKKRVSTIILS
jgi:hypothetical protein